jgi:hypothetical protein
MSALELCENHKMLLKNSFVDLGWFNGGAQNP